jgi:peptidylprolyl isomerase
MRTVRLVVSSLAALSLLAACGSEQGTDTADTSGDTSGDTSVAASVAPSTADTAAPESSADAPTTAAPNPDKPTVDIPATLPTELVVTDLVEGTGPAAKAGDVVLVNYVGVRSVDGTEFDNSYDRGEPFSVTLGAGMVIQGWDEGLVGIKQGGRRQLDIPADLAYGDNPQGDVIQPGDALTFVVDAVALVSLPDASQAPTVTVTGGPNVDQVATVDLVVGEGAEIASGQQVYIHLLAFRADSGEQLDSTWASGAPLDFVYDSGGLMPGIEQGMAGMKVGGRRQITIPFAEGFGPDGNPQLGLPPSIDLVLVIDLLAAF